ncbi:TonB-dependent receptor [Hirschia baltica]|uniref:TonB-dependent receptor n=1 Tax=Hirschia baltica (strain ATCC 49814 / DSM 5838 / IFAM 1418) TaxID=582402 RepID=C6XPM7_HIRBI|nr:TonB-dependent receptor [Hirschia baltica]ACT60292.1 TonB-dependent receptor [Hirschia baltica ATCC 49814]
MNFFNKSLKKGLFSGASLMTPILLGLCFAAPSYAQEAEEEANETKKLDTIVVQGFRSSLQEARDFKRAAVNSRESILAEDIGKMPDLNLAEAIQRVPGVAISREGGEGRNITLRGFSPSFTRTTLNGMEVPAGSDGLDSGGVTLNSGRAFDFHVFAAELFNRIDVQKTQTASIEEGGIAGTVDLYSAKPFDFEGFNFSVSGQAGYNDLTEEVDPRLALMVSDTFANDTLGALVSVAYSGRTVRQEGFGSVRWTSPFINGDSWADTNPVVNGTPSGACGAEDPLDCLWAPRLPRADFFGNEQERLGLTGSFQYQPNDKLLLTLDVLHSELTNDRRNYNSMEWLLTHGDPGNFTGQTPIEFTVDPTGQYLIAASFDDVTSWYESRKQVSESKFDQIVLSGEYQITDNISVDAMFGSAKNDATREELRFYYRSVPHFYAYDYSNNEVASVDYGDYDMNDPNNFIDVVNANNRSNDVEKENLTSKVDLTYEGDRFSINTGVAYNDRSVSYAEGIGGSAAFDPAQYTTAFPYSNFGSGLDGNLVPFLVADFDAIENDGVIPAGYTESLADSWKVGEETFATYVELNSDFDIGSMLLRANFGIRYVETTVTSEAVVGDLPISVERSYDNYLPSMNLALDVTDELVARLSYGRSMTRPGLSSLNIARPSFGYTTRTVGNLGNPELDPYESNDFDLGLEWYLGGEGLLSAAVFHKNIATNLTSEVVNKLIDEEFWPAIYADPEYDESYQADPATVPYDHSIPVNSNEGFSVKGFEITYQQPFTFLPGPLSNMGIASNYTHVEAQDSTGLSPNSYNFTLYYEDADFGGRFSVNKRDDYLLSEPGGNGHAQERKYGPTHVDFSSFYNYNDNLTFTFEIINMTDEEERIYGTGYGDLDLTREFSHTGRQFMLGARYSM